MSHFCSYFVCYCLLFKQKDYELSDVLIGDFSRSEQNIYWLNEWCRTLAGTFGMFEKCPAVIEIHDSSGPLPPFCCQLTNKKKQQTGPVTREFVQTFVPYVGIQVKCCMNTYALKLG